MRDTYTGNPIRDLGYFQWYDPLAWMETMKGFKWDTIVKKENSRYRMAIEALSSEEDLLVLQQEFEKSSRDHAKNDVFHCGLIDISPNGTYSYLWKWRGEEKHHRVAAVFSEGDFVWAIEEDQNGGEQYTVSCYQRGSEKAIWTYAKDIGPSLCVKSGICYVVEATSTLRYGILVALDAATGSLKKKLFTESSLRHTIRLEMGEHRCIFMISANSGREALYHIEGLTIQRIGSAGLSFIPVGYGSAKSDIPCFFARLRSFDEPWTAFGKELQVLSIPLALRKYRMSISLKHHLLETAAGGVRKLYRLRAGLSPQLIEDAHSSWLFDPWALWNGADEVNALRVSPGAYPTVSTFTKKGILRSDKIEEYAKKVVRHECTSKDNTIVPYLYIEGAAKKGPRGLIISTYGAYNIPTSLSTGRWKPWLERGWSVVLGLVRGGGDYGDSWAESARRHMKIRSIEDTEAVIKSAQKLTGIPPSSTCIHGVSAGGYLLGALVARHSEGDLFGAAYAHVPYLDVLRTTTNPNLPLTILEYDEFGNPAEKLEDLTTILALSPVDALPERGAPPIFVIARTSIYDVEVLPYESVKWIYRLRGWPKPVRGGEEKYLAITAGAGHFVRGSKGSSQDAEDFLLLNNWLSSKTQGRV
jgi:hypothetical protein